MRLLPDERLYTDTDYCLAHLRARWQPADPLPGPRWRAHFYWHGAVGRKQAAALASFLATHDDRAEIWLWLDADHGYEQHAANPWLAPLLSRVAVKRFHTATEAAGTPVERDPLVDGRLPPVRKSNLVRTIVLFKYGGFYSDLDMFFLRDLSALFTEYGAEFCYRWSADQPYGNSAALALGRESAAAHALLERCRRHGSFRPRDVLRFEDTPDLDLLVLPCAFFDPLWPIRDGRDRTSSSPFHSFDDFFRRFGWRLPPPAVTVTLDSFFPGAFAYHWHNGWHLKEHEQSFFGQLELYAARRLALRLPL